jgi:hypothetical protein
MKKILGLLLLLSMNGFTQESKPDIKVIGQTVDDFFTIIYFKDASMRKTIQDQVKRKISQHADLSSEKSFRESLNVLVESNNERNTQIEDVINRQVERLNFCNSLRDVLIEEPKVNAQKFSASQLGQMSVDRVVQVYAHSEYQHGIYAGKMAEVSLKLSSCATELRSCMEQKRGGADTKVDESMFGKDLLDDSKVVRPAGVMDK